MLALRQCCLFITSFCIIYTISAAVYRLYSSAAVCTNLHHFIYMLRGRQHFNFCAELYSNMHAMLYVPPGEDYGDWWVERDAAATCCSQISSSRLSRFPENWLFKRYARELIIASGQRLRFFGIALPAARWSHKLIGCCCTDYWFAGRLSAQSHIPYHHRLRLYIWDLGRDGKWYRICFIA